VTSLAQYDAARAALAAATRIDEVLPLWEQMQHLKLHAKHVQNKELLAEAADIQIRAEAKLGFLLVEAEKAGHIRQGRPKKADPKNPTNLEGFTLKEIGVSHRLSADSQRKASISDQALEAMITGVRQRIMKGRAKIIEEVDAADQKKVARDNRERVLGVLQRALPDKKFGVILADPEWRFKPYSRETGMDRAADNQYPTTETDRICARPVGSIAAKDCVLFLWATAPMLPDALRVMEAWGFEYKSHVIWKKDRLGTGYWFRNQHELLLVGTTGNIPAPAMGTQFASVIDAPRGKHSQKPDSFYELIEAYFPTLPKIELNARRARDGWERWGNESPPETPHDPETGEVIESNSPDVAIEEGGGVAGACSASERGENRTHGLARDVAAGLNVEPEPDVTGGESAAPAFPPTEFADLRKLANSQPLDGALAKRLPAYVTRGLVTDALGPWRLTQAGEIRLDVVQRERKQRIALCKKHLDENGFWDWSDLSAIAGCEHVDSASVRSLVGLDLACCDDDSVVLTDAGRVRLVSLDALVDAAAATGPRQIDLEELLVDREPVDLPLFLSAKEPAA
jgi:N6-adenosine-specific RNA methylase IME4